MRQSGNGINDDHDDDNGHIEQQCEIYRQRYEMATLQHLTERASNPSIPNFTIAIHNVTRMSVCDACMC